MEISTYYITIFNLIKICSYVFIFIFFALFLSVIIHNKYKIDEFILMPIISIILFVIFLFFKHIPPIIYIIGFILIVILIFIISIIILMILFDKYEKDKIFNQSSLDFKLTKLCNDLIFNKYNNYNQIYIEYKETYRHNFKSEETYIKSLINIVDLIEKNRSEKISTIMGYYAILVASISIIISLFNSDNNNVIIIIGCLLVILFILYDIIRLICNTTIINNIRINNFKNYLEEELKKLK